MTESTGGIKELQTIPFILSKIISWFLAKKNKHQIGLCARFYDGIINGDESMSAICRDKKKRNCVLLTEQFQDNHYNLGETWVKSDQPLRQMH